MPSDLHTYKNISLFTNSLFESLISQGLSGELLAKLFSSAYSQLNLEGLVSPKEVLQDIVKCELCSHYFSGDFKEPSWNFVNPDSIFILDQPLIDKDSIDLFISSIKKVGYDPKTSMLFYLLPYDNVNLSSLEDDMIQHLSLHLNILLLSYSPKVVIASGKTTSQCLLSDSTYSFSENRGKVYWHGFYNIVPTYSITYLKLSNSKTSLSEFISDLTLARNVTSRCIS